MGGGMNADPGIQGTPLAVKYRKYCYYCIAAHVSLGVLFMFTDY